MCSQKLGSWKIGYAIILLNIIWKYRQKYKQMCVVVDRSIFYQGIATIPI